MSEKKRRGLSTHYFVLFVVAIAFLVIVSVYSLHFGYNLYLEEEEAYFVYMILGSFGLILAAYGSYQLRRHIVIIQPIEFNVVTVTECEKCGFKKIREFKLEDYVLKSNGTCPKCEGATLITSIYHEEGEKTIFS